MALPFFLAFPRQTPLASFFKPVTSEYPLDSIRDFAWPSVKLFRPATGEPGLLRSDLLMAELPGPELAGGFCVCAAAGPADNSKAGTSTRTFRKIFPLGCSVSIGGGTVRALQGSARLSCALKKPSERMRGWRSPSPRSVVPGHRIDHCRVLSDCWELFHSSLAGLTPFRLRHMRLAIPEAHAILQSFSTASGLTGRLRARRECKAALT
jgi:hypothetical protein